MKRVFVFLVIISMFSCGYKARMYPQESFCLKSFQLKDPFLLEFKKEIEWGVEKKLTLRGFYKSQSPDSDIVISLTLTCVKTITVQSGSDNRQTAKQFKYLLECDIWHKGKKHHFSSPIFLYQKFPVKQEFMVDRRSEIVEQLIDQISLKVNSWITKITL